MKNTKTKGALHSLAKQAKERLKSYNKNSVFSQSYTIQTFSHENAILYKKVCQILESDEVITNPIMELIDKDYYNSLSSEAKQKYIFDLSDKYRAMKERYFKEKSLQMSKAVNS